MRSSCLCLFSVRSKHMSAFIVAFKKKKKERKKTKKTEDLMLQRNGKQAVEVELWKSRVFACES